MGSTVCRIAVIDDNTGDRVDLRQMLRSRSNRRYRFTDADHGLDGSKLTLDAQRA